MSKLQAVQIDGETIFIEAKEDAIVPEVIAEETGEYQRGGAKGINGRTVEMQASESFQAIQSTIKTYTKYTLNAFKDAALAEVEKVTLEFGLNVSGTGGVPYIAAGTVGCNIKVTVECAFPNRQAEARPQHRFQAGVPQRPAEPGIAAVMSPSNLSSQGQQIRVAPPREN